MVTNNEDQTLSDFKPPEFYFSFLEFILISLNFFRPLNLTSDFSAALKSYYNTPGPKNRLIFQIVRVPLVFLVTVVT